MISRRTWWVMTASNMVAVTANSFVIFHFGVIKVPFNDIAELACLAAIAAMLRYRWKFGFRES